MKRKLIFILMFLLLIGCSPNKDTEDENIENIETEEVIKDEVEETNNKKVDLDGLLAEEMPIFLQFSQKGCPPCEEMLPYVLDLQENFEERVNIRVVDVFENIDLSRKMGITLTPTQVFITSDGEYFSADDLMGVQTVEVNGEEIVQHVGFIPEDALIEILETLEK